MTNKEIVQALRCSATKEEQKSCDICQRSKRGCFECINSYLYEAASLIEQMTAENVVLPDGQASTLESLRKEIEWKDMVIALAQRKQAEAEAERDALLGKWINVDGTLPAPGMRVVATDGVFVGEAYRTSAGTWSRYDGMAMRDCLGSVVTHWMPLPEAPEEGDKHGTTDK